MKNGRITKIFTIPMALIELLCRHFRTTNSSEAIYKGIAGFLSNSAYGKRMNDFALHQILSIEERKTNKKYSVRISSELKQILEDTIVVDTIYNGVSIILANYLYYSKVVSEIVVSPDENKIELPEDIQVNKSMYLLRLLGSKWNKKMQYAIRKILSTSKKEWETRIEVFAGALGSFCEFPVCMHEIINDLDLQKINLYRAIKNTKEDVLIKICAEQVDEQTFERNKNAVANGLDLDNKKVNIDAAVSFLYINLLSVRNIGITYKKMNPKKYREMLNAIYPLSERLKDTEICGLDALEIIKKHKKDSDTVFIVDPPYLDANVYKDSIIDRKYGDDKREFAYREHVELARLLRETHQKYDNDFIYFCRTTITRVKDQKTKDITNLGELDTGDRHLQGKIDDLYWGYGFYYIDVPYDKDGTIERIITSFEFDGATPYGKCEGTEVTPFRRTDAVSYVLSNAEEVD